MRKVNIHEAKTTLSQLVEAAEAGERVVLARAGKSVVELVQLAKKRGIKLGVLKGRLPQKLLDDVAKPLTKTQVKRLFGTAAEP
ncbi:MAG: type II toxin-antitoxin system prevent-host-death family antitoxin [Gammaproteobacteria bacterium]|nr:type II toxin-antitoxin system prevent-host-death family antitoxin [Gammaproteobacteria bacterium]